MYKKIVFDENNEIFNTMTELFMIDTNSKLDKTINELSDILISQYLDNHELFNRILSKFNKVVETEQWKEFDSDEKKNLLKHFISKEVAEYFINGGKIKDPKQSKIISDLSYIILSCNNLKTKIQENKNYDS